MHSDVATLQEAIDRDIAAQAKSAPRSGKNSVFVCPECGGVLWQVDEEGVAFFQCHIGHTYHPRLLLQQKSEHLEALLYTAVRTLTEKATLTRELSAELLGQESPDERTLLDDARARLEALAELDEKHGRLIRQVLLEAYPNPTSQAYLVEEALEGLES